MVTTLPVRPLAEALTLEIDEVKLEGASKYDIAGVYSFGRGIFSRGTILGEETSYQKMHRLHKGQIVMSRLKAFEGAICLVPDRFDETFLSPEFPTFALRSGTEARYLGYICQWPDFWSLLNRDSKGLGARRERVSASKLLSIAVPLPSLIEQCRIADKLDTLLGRADEVGVLRKKISVLQSGLFASLVDSAIEGNHQTVRVGDVLRFDRTPVEIDSRREYRTIGIRSFGRGIIRYPSAPGENLSKLNYFTFPKDALALSNLMAWEGGISVTRTADEGHIASNRFFFYLPANDRANVSYLRYFLLSKPGQALIASACSAGAERNRTLGRKRFEALTFPLPPRPVQDQVARTLDALAEKLNSAYAEPALDALRPSILNAAFTGQL
ncbi:hypothetical protein DMH03_09640 [Amycolatopsis sp. WAC 01376]|uniref:restriction endonuclease subunit S n=1 Tax=Amycolatopsis sp. WAC 01376 TaxID=2203195 RepID=UPI000F78B59D|nr:restriction endonuclease subunit S [Amycolatopsis sp. WAC 01376]RSM62368.1 hypothetical protein DMH03_09640 [Amycolatopsis sp. WAC 01376]